MNSKNCPKASLVKKIIQFMFIQNYKKNNKKLQSIASKVRLQLLDQATPLM